MNKHVTQQQIRICEFRSKNGYNGPFTTIAFETHPYNLDLTNDSFRDSWFRDVKHLLQFIFRFTR